MRPPQGLALNPLVRRYAGFSCSVAPGMGMGDCPRESWQRAALIVEIGDMLTMKHLEAIMARQAGQDSRQGRQGGEECGEGLRWARGEVKAQQRASAGAGGGNPG